MVHVCFQPSWIVRTAGPVEGLTAQMQRALASADPDLPFSGFYNMRDLMAKTLATQRIEVALLSAMAALALLLSTMGIFALVANIVAQKTREIGIRIALGSTVRQAMVHIGAPGVWASTLGLLLGLVLCAGALRAMRSVLYGVSVYDVPTILIVVLTLAGGNAGCYHCAGSPHRRNRSRQDVARRIAEPRRALSLSGYIRTSEASLAKPVEYDSGHRIAVVVRHQGMAIAVYPERRQLHPRNVTAGSARLSRQRSTAGRE